MSRIAKVPLNIPSGVEFKKTDNNIHVKGPKGALDFAVPASVTVTIDGNVVQVSNTVNFPLPNPMVGTTRKLLGNMVHGVHTGFEIGLRLVGVGYRAKVVGKVLELSLGFSHPVNFAIPAGITIDTPSATDIVVKGFDKQRLGQVAAKIRGFRPPEVYKGKGVRYTTEQVVLKETKKK